MAHTLPFGIRSLLGHRDDDQDMEDDSHGASSSSSVSDSPVMMSSPEPPMTDFKECDNSGGNFGLPQMPTDADLSKMDTKALNQWRQMLCLQLFYEQMLRSQFAAATNQIGGNGGQYQALSAQMSTTHSPTSQQQLPTTSNRETPINYSKTSAPNQCQQRSSGESRH